MFHGVLAEVPILGHRLIKLNAQVHQLIEQLDQKKGVN